MKSFASEEEMHDRLRNQLKKIGGIADIIDDLDTLKEYQPLNLSEKKLSECFKYCSESLYFNTLV